MQLEQAIELIQDGVNSTLNIWADLGCGNGLFTNALSQLLEAGSIVYAIDKNKQALNNVVVKDEISLIKTVADFVNDDLPFKNLSGILMANSFHYVQYKKELIEKLIKYFNANGYFLIVEYDTDIANRWVPYPAGFNSLKKFFAEFGYAATKLK